MYSLVRQRAWPPMVSSVTIQQRNRTYLQWCRLRPTCFVWGYFTQWPTGQGRAGRCRVLRGTLHRPNLPPIADPKSIPNTTTPAIGVPMNWHLLDFRPLNRGSKKELPTKPSWNANCRNPGWNLKAREQKTLKCDVQSPLSPLLPRGVRHTQSFHAPGFGRG